MALGLNVSLAALTVITILGMLGYLMDKHGGS